MPQQEQHAGHELTCFSGSTVTYRRPDAGYELVASSQDRSRRPAHEPDRSRTIRNPNYDERQPQPLPLSTSLARAGTTQRYEPPLLREPSLRDLYVHFVAIPVASTDTQSEFGAYARFIETYPHILDADTNSMQRQAAGALERDEYGVARRYMHLMLLLHACNGLTADQRIAHVRNLARSSNSQAIFEQKFNKIKSALVPEPRASVLSTSATNVPSSGPLNSQMQNLNMSGTTRPRLLSRDNSSHQDSTQTSAIQRRDRHPSFSQSQPASLAALAPGARPFSLGESQQSARPAPNRGRVRSSVGNAGSTLDRSFQVQTDPRHFFVFGRVFRVLWHEPSGASLNGQVPYNNVTSIGKFGEGLYTTLRWMLVVKEGSAHCICSPISTYGGRGLSKNLSQSDIAAHAIIHATDAEPQPLPGEPRMSKVPIPVSVRNHDLNPIQVASRVNFSQLHTVQHNVKVAEVGMVPERFHDYVRQYSILRDLRGR